MRPDPFADLAKHLTEFTDAYLAVHRSHSAQYASPSPAATDVEALGGRASWAGQQLHDATIASALLGLAVIDNLRALRQLLDPPSTVYAPSVLARAALEAAAAVWHVSEPGIEPTERLRRSLNDSLIALHESRRLRIQMGPPEAVSLIDEQIAEIRVQSQGLGWSLQTPRRGPSHLGEKRPSDTRLCAEILSTQQVGATAYRMLSAVAHARHHGLYSALTPIGQSGEAVDRKEVSFDINSRQVALRLLPGPLSAIHMTRRLFTYLGWQSRNVTLAMSSLIEGWGAIARTTRQRDLHP